MHTLSYKFMADQNTDVNDYKLGFIYYKKTDPRLFIPKASGLGWTLNFSNFWSYIVLALLIGLIIFCLKSGLSAK